MQINNSHEQEQDQGMLMDITTAGHDTLYAFCFTLHCHIHIHILQQQWK